MIKKFIVNVAEGVGSAVGTVAGVVVGTMAGAFVGGVAGYKLGEQVAGDAARTRLNMQPEEKIIEAEVVQEPTPIKRTRKTQTA